MANQMESGSSERTTTFGGGVDPSFDAARGFDVGGGLNPRATYTTGRFADPYASGQTDGPGMILDPYSIHRSDVETGKSIVKRVLVGRENYVTWKIAMEKQKQALARQLNLSPRQVEVWYQNRRARTKLKQNEQDYEYLKKCCETLTEENKRLLKELKELKTLKQAQLNDINKFPAATLSLCPSCEGVTTTPTRGGGGSSSSKPRFFNATTY